MFASVIALGVALFQVGRAADLNAKSQTAADAAALAGAHSVKDQIMQAMLHGGEGFDPSQINRDAVYRAAEDYAQRNGGHLVGPPTFDGFDVLVTVQTKAKLDDANARDQGVAGYRGVEKARATLGASYNFNLGGIPGGAGPFGGLGSSGGANFMSAAELADVADKAGGPVRADSALRRYGGCGCQPGSIDVRDLAPFMKVAIVKAENLLGHGLNIISGYRTTSYQAFLCATQGGQGGRCAAAGTSYHQLGLAIDVVPPWDLAAIAPKVGLCQPFPGPGDDNNHISPLSGSECGGSAGGPAYGPGGVASFVSFDIHLVRYAG